MSQSGHALVAYNISSFFPILLEIGDLTFHRIIFITPKKNIINSIGKE